MPYKDKNKRLEHSKLWKRNKKIEPIIHKESLRNTLYVPIEVPDIFYHDVRRFDLLYDTIQMKQRLAEKTRFNKWMSYHLDVLEEIQHRERAYVIYKQMEELGQLTEWSQIPEYVVI